jgi:hypothetical protein
VEFTVSVSLRGAAMLDEAGEPDPVALAGILTQVVSALEAGMSVRYLGSHGTLRDANGNRVGSVTLTG